MRGGEGVEIETLTEKVTERLVELVENKTPTKEEVDVLKVLSELFASLIVHHRMNRHS